jgi:Circularly permutated YpsA SLOG family
MGIQGYGENHLMLSLVISTGQTGAARAGWRAAKAAGIATSGAMPLGFLAEDGPHPEFEEEFNAHELLYTGPADRTEENVLVSCGTLWFGSSDSHAGLFAMAWAEKVRKPFLLVPLRGDPVPPSQVADWLADQNIRILNVAGSRESRAPGIGARVEAFLDQVFALSQQPAKA